MRTKTLTSVIFLLLSGAAFAQKPEPMVAIELEKHNVFYKGFDNPVTILIEGYGPATADQVTATNAEVRQAGTNLYIRPKESGEMQITVTTPVVTVKRKYLVETVKCTPLLGARYPNASVMGVGEFKAQLGMGSVVGCCGFDAKCDVEHFQVLKKAFRSGDRRLFNLGGRFTEATRNTIDEAQPGDVYLFYDITVRCPGDTESRNLGALQITIK